MPNPEIIAIAIHRFVQPHTHECERESSAPVPDDLMTCTVNLKYIDIDDQ